MKATSRATSRVTSRVTSRYIPVLCSLVVLLSCSVAPPPRSNSGQLSAHEKNYKYKLLAMPAIGQETRKWCWAASGEMLSRFFFGEGVPQFRQANALLMKKNKTRENPGCGSVPRPFRCITGGLPMFNQLNLRSDFTPGPLSWEELTAQIDAGKPVGFIWKWVLPHRRMPGKVTSHYMVARGYLIIGGVKMVVVNDPLPQTDNETKGGTVTVMTYRDYLKFEPKYKILSSHFNITIKDSVEDPLKAGSDGNGN